MQRAGEYHRNLSGETEYKLFRPAPLPVETDMDAEMIKLLTDATKAFEDYLGILRKDTRSSKSM